jgi:pantetheine-phosphate adenylyltransferase
MARSQKVLYPGSFDPITKGHISVILRLMKMFDEVVVLVAESSRKKHVFSAQERVLLIREALGKRQKGVEVLASRDLTVNVARERGIHLIARSVRSVSDWDHEYSLADANKRLNPKVETIFVMADPQYTFISSSLVREVASFGGDTAVFVPANVAKALKRLYGAPTKTKLKR